MAFANELIVTLSNLRAGDVVQTTYSSKGCFHARELELTFRRSTSTVATIDEVELRKPEGQRELKRIPRNLGELTLSDADVAGLDRFLQRIRGVQERGQVHIEDLSTWSPLAEATGP